MKGSQSSGKLLVVFDMNATLYEVDLMYKRQGNQLKITGEIDLADWQAATTLDYMEDCCKSYHTGSDGVHLVWPQVKLELKTNLSEIESFNK